MLNVEAGGKVGALAAVAHAACVGALAQAESQCAQQYGFTRPGFPRDGGHATAEVEFKAVNNRVILDR